MSRLPVLASVDPMRSSAVRMGGGNSQQSRNVLRISALEHTVFSVAYVTVRNNELPPTASWLLEVVEDVQLFGFALNSHFHSDIPSTVQAIFTPVDYFLSSSYSTLVAATTLTLTLIFLTVILASYVGLLVHWSINVPILALRMQRILFTLQMTVLTIPMAEVLMMALDCAKVSSQYQLSCTSAAYLPLFVLSALGLIVFVPLMLIGSLVFIDNSATTKLPNAKSHGRMEFKILLLRYSFAALVTFATGTETGDVWCMVLIGTALLYLMVYMAYSRPYFDQKMTNIRVAFFAGASGAMWMTLVCYYARLAVGWALAVIPVSIVCFLLGLFTAEKWTAISLANTVRRWHRVQKLEEDEARQGFGGGRMQKTIAEGDEEAPGDTYGPRGATFISAAGGLEPPLEKWASQPTKANTILSVQFPKTKWASSITEFANINTSMEALKIVTERRVVNQARVFCSPIHVEACLRFLRRDPTLAQMAIGRQLILRGLGEFPGDALMYFFADTYLHAFYGESGVNRAAELMDECKKRKPVFDVKFLVYARERDEADQRKMASGGGGNEQLHVLESTEYQNLDRQVRQQHLLALQATRDFWEAIRSVKSPSFIASILSRISSHTVLAEGSYSRLAAKFPSNKNILRAYANFLTSVKADTAKATHLLQLADAAEAREERQMVRASANLPNTKDGSDSDSEKEKGGVPSKQEVDTFKPSANIEVPSTSGPEWNLGESEPEIHPPPTSVVENHRPSLKPTSKVAGMHSQKALSQTSGTSFSQAERRLLKARKSLEMQIAKPIKQKMVINAAVAVTLALLIAGYMYCVQFFNQTDSLTDREFRMAKMSQAIAAHVMDLMQDVVTSGIWSDTITLNSTYQDLDNSLLAMEQAVIPFLSDEQAFDTTTYRVSTRRVTTAMATEIIDFHVEDATTLQLVNQLARAAGTIIARKSGVPLSAVEFMNMTNTAFVMDNIGQILQCLKALPLYGVQIFIQSLSNSQTVLLVLASATCVLVIGIGFLLYAKVFKACFAIEDKAMEIFRGIPKRTATELLTLTESEIETYCEVTDVDDLDEVNAKLIDGEGAAGADRANHRMLTVVSRMLIFTLLLIMGLTAGMYGMTLKCMGVQNYMTMAVESIQRSFYLQQFVLAGQTILFPGSPMISLNENAQLLRGAILDLSTQPTSTSQLNLIFPNLTSYPRNCSSTSADACAQLAFNDTIGFTKTVVSASMNDEIKQFLTIADSFTTQGIASATAVALNSTVLPSSQQLTPRSSMWKLILSISADLTSRLAVLDLAIMQKVSDEIDYHRFTCAAIFAATIVVAISAAAYLQWIGLGMLLHRANSVAALFMVIPPALWKEVPIIQKVIESGGALLTQKES